MPNHGLRLLEKINTQIGWISQFDPNTGAYCVAESQDVLARLSATCSTLSRHPAPLIELKLLLNGLSKAGSATVFIAMPLDGSRLVYGCLGVPHLVERSMRAGAIRTLHRPGLPVPLSCGEVAVERGDSLILMHPDLPKQIADQVVLLAPDRMEGFIAQLPSDKSGIAVLFSDHSWHIAREMGFEKEALAVSKSVLFRNLTEEEIRLLLSIATVREYNPGEYVMVRGDIGDRLDVLVSGELKVHTHRKNQPIRKDVGDCFGELAFFDAHPRSVTVEALTRTRMLEFSFDALRDLMRTRPEFAVEVLNAMGYTAAVRLRQSGDSRQKVLLSRYPARLLPPRS